MTTLDEAKQDLQTVVERLVKSKKGRKLVEQLVELVTKDDKFKDELHEVAEVAANEDLPEDDESSDDDVESDIQDRLSTFDTSLGASLSCHEFEEAIVEIIMKNVDHSI